MYVLYVMQRQVFIHILLIVIAQLDFFMMELDAHYVMQHSQHVSNAYQIKYAYNVSIILLLRKANVYAIRSIIYLILIHAYSAQLGVSLVLEQVFVQYVMLMLPFC